jgi:hypothetical protein
VVADPEPVGSDPKFFAGSGVGSGKNHSGSGYGQPGIKIKQNFSDKVHNISNLCTIEIKKLKKILKKFLSKALSYTKISLYCKLMYLSS